MSGTHSINDDRALGRQNEVDTKAIIERHFNVEITKTKDPFFVIDFVSANKKFWCELKRRLVNHDAYPTAIISKHKVDFCQDPDATYVFVWRYNDGVYYIKYDKEKFSKYEVKMYRRFDRTDHHQMASPHYFIPVTDLLKIE